MKLIELIKDIEGCTVRGSSDIEVRDLAYNASSVKPGFCFVAMRGVKADGHSFVKDAVSRGATAIVAERSVDVPASVAGVLVRDSREALSLMSAKFFGEPSKSMTLVGVTGTNGKTTITYLLEAIFRARGKNPGVIGTVEYRFGGRAEKAPRTTPESYELERLLCRMKDAGVDVCAMEVSSHALIQHRADGCHFDAAVFTNLTPEHLDYHGDMESYFKAKVILFEKLLSMSAKRSPFAAINIDDSYGKELAGRCPVPVVTYGIYNDADVRGKNLIFDAKGLKMQVETPSGAFECRSRLCGKFNAQNILAAVSVAVRMGIGPAVIADALTNVSVVPGRFESIENGRGILALVDYAHTPDAIENVLANARELISSNGGRVIAVFGCGGDRDRAKRPLMGEAAARLADVLIVTSDNPRTEDPQAIIDEILPGVRESVGTKEYEVIPDRKAAIARAVLMARAGDVLIVAGKGHEDYQIIGKERTHFDDREILREILGKSS